VHEWGFYFRLQSAGELEEELQSGGQTQQDLFSEEERARAKGILSNYFQVAFLVFSSIAFSFLFFILALHSASPP